MNFISVDSSFWQIFQYISIDMSHGNILYMTKISLLKFYPLGIWQKIDIISAVISLENLELEICIFYSSKSYALNISEQNIINFKQTVYLISPNLDGPNYGRPLFGRP